MEVVACSDPVLWSGPFWEVVCQGECSCEGNLEAREVARGVEVFPCIFDPVGNVLCSVQDVGGEGGGKVGSPVSLGSGERCNSERLRPRVIGECSRSSMLKMGGFGGVEDLLEDSVRVGGRHTVANSWMKSKN